MKMNDLPTCVLNRNALHIKMQLGSKNLNDFEC